MNNFCLLSLSFQVYYFYLQYWIQRVTQGEWSISRLKSWDFFMVQKYKFSSGTQWSPHFGTKEIPSWEKCVDSTLKLYILAYLYFYLQSLQKWRMIYKSEIKKNINGQVQVELACWKFHTVIILISSCVIQKKGIVKSIN